MAVTLDDIKKLREMTKAGIADCKKALTEANGDFDEAMKLIRERGQAIAAKRSDREAQEGCVLAGTNGEFAAIVAVKCETDFVAKNEDFVNLTKKVLGAVLENQPSDIEAVKALQVDGMSIVDLIAERSGQTGEKMELGAYEYLKGASVSAYNHQGNMLASIVAFNEAGVSAEVSKNIALQVAGYSPIAIDENDVPEEIKERELEIGREKARQEGKPEAILDRIAQGRLSKFYKESTLFAQEFTMDEKITVGQYLKAQGATVSGFKRLTLNQE